MAVNRSLICAVLFLVCISFTQGKYLAKRFGPPPVGKPNLKAVTPDWGWITQRVDHFNPVDTRKWEMRYLNNSQFFKPGGPMFIFLGGEWIITPGRLQSGQMFDMAQKHNGYMFYTEHRFYGLSYPTKDFSSASLRYLSVDQALGDIAYFIEYQKAHIPGLNNSKVVVVGGSYSAMLATWARLKYPHLVTVAYASSAPLKSVEDFYEYFEVISNNLELTSKECAEVISKGTAETEALFGTVEGRANVTRLYNTCSPVVNTEPQKSFFFNTVGEVFAALVQNAYPGKLTTECKRLLGFPGSALDKLAAYYRYSFNGDCSDTYTEFLKTYAHSNTTQLIYRQWYYQCCTEYGFFQTTTSQKQLFGKTFPISLYHNICSDLFGKEYTPEVLRTAVNRTNIFNGGVYPEITNLISTHGSVDPWHPLGIRWNTSLTNQAIFVQGTAHCADLSSVSPSDLPEMQMAKLKIQDLIAKWISN